MTTTTRPDADAADTSVSADVTALSQRAAVMMAFRTALATVVTLLATTSGAAPVLATALLAAAYLAVTGVLSLCVLSHHRALAVRVFGLSLLVDGVFLQYQFETLGHRVSVDVAVAAELVAVCLLASFRTGLKIALWQSLLLLVAVRGEQTGLFPMPPAMRGVDRNAQLFTDMSLLWLVVVTTAVAAAVNERELRRRRYDAQALAKLATQLHGDERPDHVASRLVRFVADELDATRALVCRTGPHGLCVVAGHGLGATPAPSASGRRAAGRDLAAQSALLSMVATRHRATLALRLDPELDPWLTAVMPDARRIVAVSLGQPATNWLVLEDAARRGRRAERRIVSTVSQAAATAALALSRAELLERAEQAAATDPLTGVANRRTFDRSMLRCLEAWDRRGVPFALVLVDVDHFKQVNDRYGHQVGDETLQAVAQVLREHAGGDDMAARYGGEEFAVIMPGADAAAAARRAEHARLALHDLGGPVRVTASFGVAAVPGDADATADLIAAADTALLRAKAAGRDRVLTAGQAVADLSQGV